MKKLLGILFACLTLTTYSQEYDDLYYTVYDDTTSVSSDTLVEENTTYVTYNYYTDYPSYTSRMKRFHSDFWYVSYWSFNNIFWYSFYYPYNWYNYSWYNPYNYYSGYYGGNYYSWYPYHHHNNHWYNNHSYASNTYYGPHYRKATGNKNIKTVKTVSKIKPKPVIKREVRSVNKPTKTQTTYTSRSKSQNSSNKVRAYNGVNTRTYNKSPKPITPRRNYTSRPTVTKPQTYKRPTQSFTPRNNSISPRTSSSPTKHYSRPRPR